MPPLITLEGVSKTYRTLMGRPVHAVDGATLEIAAGDVLGIAGPNGAGKSTLLAMLLGLVNPTSGSIRIAGMAPRRYVERYGVSYLPELIALPTYWTAQQALRRLAVLAGIPPSRVSAEVERVIDALQIGEHRRKRLKALSKGNLQRVGLAQALLVEAEVVIFDEPTHGLDPVWTQRFRDVVRGMRRSDRVIIIASHNLDELERLADRVAIIDRGRIQRVVSMGPGAAARTAAWRIRPIAGADVLLAHFAGATQDANGDILSPDASVELLNASLAAALATGARISGIVPRESALEQAFRSVVGGA